MTSANMPSDRAYSVSVQQLWLARKQEALKATKVER